MNCFTFFLPLRLLKLLTKVLTTNIALDRSILEDWFRLWWCEGRWNNVFWRNLKIYDWFRGNVEDWLSTLIKVWLDYFWGHFYRNSSRWRLRLLIHTLTMQNRRPYLKAHTVRKFLVGRGSYKRRKWNCLTQFEMVIMKFTNTIDIINLSHDII